MTDLTSWVAIMAHGMFYTDFVATAVYGGQPDAAPGSVYDLLFDEGVGSINRFCNFANFAILQPGEDGVLGTAVAQHHRRSLCSFYSG